MSLLRFQTETILPKAGIKGGQTSSDLSLGERCFIGLEPGTGKMTADTRDGLKIAISPIDQAPAWVEFRRKAVGCIADAGLLVIRLQASAREKARLGLALRINAKDGFNDLFSSPVALTPEPKAYDREIRVSPRDLHGATSYDLMVFFEPKSGEYDLSSLTITAMP